MKEIRLPKNIYIFIFVMAVMVSLLQMNLLGKGLMSIISVGSKAPEFVHQQTSKSVAAVQKENTPFKPFVPTHIVIDQIGLDMPVTSVPFKNGTWEVLDGVANYAEGTSPVNNTGGNVGIYAHDKLNGFAKIKMLQSGKSSDIILIGNTFKATYRFDSASIVAPTAVDVFNPTKEPTLTLVTCDGILAQKRFVLKAKLIRIEKIENEKI